jgi:hypothetical protein
MDSRYIRTLAPAVILVSLLIAKPAWAQSPTEDANRWEFTVAPYILAPHMDGQTTIRGFPVDVDVGPGDILERLDFGAMLYLEMANRDWSISLDGLYMNLGETVLTPITGREVERPDFAAQGYARGVPMGGDLTSAPSGAAPTFVVRALRDPDGANLDRVQIIKGWLGADGKTQERIYDVAVSDGRTIGSDGRCKTPVGNTVDVADASYANSIGDALLRGYWRDPVVHAIGHE